MTSQLQCMPDFERVLARFEAWWVCQIIDRPLVSVNVKPARPPKPPAKHHASLRDRWMDTEYVLDCFEASLAGAVFVGEHFPKFTPNVGPDLCATLFGAELQFSETTSWSKPIFDSCRQILEIEPDLDTVYWNKIRELTDQSLQRGRRKWLTGIADLHANCDLLAALRDPTELCLEFADDIEGVRLALDRASGLFGRIYDDLYNRLAAAGQPTASTCPLLHSGKANMIQDDFICLISPQMFDETIRPAIAKEIDYLNRSMFHLDGPDALRHLDSILAIEKLNGLQWVYGAGNGPGQRWIEVYQKAQQAGKCIQVKAASVADAITLTEHLKPEGVWFTVAELLSRDQAEGFLKQMERWAAGKDP